MAEKELKEAAVERLMSIIASSSGKLDEEELMSVHTLQTLIAALERKGGQERDG